MEEHIKLKKRTWGTLNGVWVPQSIWDAVVQFVSRWAGRTKLPIWRVLRWLGLARSKFDRWSWRLGTPNQHNGRIPRDFWLEDWEKAAIIAFHTTSIPWRAILGYIEEAWAEDRATRGRDPSADPGAKHRRGRHDAAPRPTGTGPKAINPCTVFVLSH